MCFVAAVRIRFANFQDANVKQNIDVICEIRKLLSQALENMADTQRKAALKSLQHILG